MKTAFAILSGQGLSLRGERDESRKRSRASGTRATCAIQASIAASISCTSTGSTTLNSLPAPGSL